MWIVILSETKDPFLIRHSHESWNPEDDLTLCIPLSVDTEWEDV